MKNSNLMIAAGARALAGCGQARVPATVNNAQAIAAAQTYSGTGTIQNVAGNQVTIKHGPVAGIGWPAMTMTFSDPGDLARGVKVGSDVDFSFRQNGSAYQLTSIRGH